MQGWSPEAQERPTPELDIWDFCDAPKPSDQTEVIITLITCFNYANFRLPRRCFRGRSSGRDFDLARDALPPDRRGELGPQGAQKDRRKVRQTQNCILMSKWTLKCSAARSSPGRTCWSSWPSWTGRNPRRWTSCRSSPTPSCRSTTWWWESSSWRTPERFQLIPGEKFCPWSPFDEWRLLQRRKAKNAFERRIPGRSVGPHLRGLQHVRRKIEETPLKSMAHDGDIFVAPARKLDHSFTFITSRAISCSEKWWFTFLY